MCQWWSWWWLLLVVVDGGGDMVMWSGDMARWW